VVRDLERTELLAYRGEVDPDLPLDETMGAPAGTFTHPFRYGYSAVGRVVQPATPFREGQQVFAFHPHQDRFVADARQVVAVDDLDPRAATLYPTSRPPSRSGNRRLGAVAIRLFRSSR
jgi:NADPH:quinone reductase-like Zn-dependent oxidoreductase